MESVDHDGQCAHHDLQRDRFIGVMKKQEAGTKTADICRKHAISPATFYKFKAKFGGLEVSDARRLRALETRMPG
ncbi:transposase [Aurantimonas sp. DM33-3]|nr:transposase [Aurantimonas sp. DM33-3]